MKRVLHIVGGMDRAGAETMIMNLYRHIDRSQIQFDFLYFKTKACDYDKEILALGGIIHRIIEKNSVSRFYRITEFLKQHPEYKIVHCHTLFNIGINMLAAKLANVPLRIAHSHNTRSQLKTSFVYSLYQSFSRFLINRFATDFIACGVDASDFLFGGHNKALVIYNSINVDEYDEIGRAHQNSLRQEFSLSADCKVFVQIGRLEQVKNHLFSLQIMRKLKDQGHSFRFFIIGQGKMEEKIKEEIAALDMSEEVLLIGVREDIPRIMAGADAMLMPSLFEGFPVVLVESQAVGLRSIISDTISKEVDLQISLIDFMSLNDNAQIWANKLMAAQSKKPEDKNSSVLKEQGFDVKSNAIILTNLYNQTDKF